jgi:hypothetical protein
MVAEHGDSMSPWCLLWGRTPGCAVSPCRVTARNYTALRRQFQTAPRKSEDRKISVAPVLASDYNAIADKLHRWQPNPALRLRSLPDFRRD